VPEVHSRRVYTFKAIEDHQLSLGAAEIRNAVLNLGKDMNDCEFDVDILSEKENQIIVECRAATGPRVYEMDHKIMVKVINFCETHNLDFSVSSIEARLGDEDEWN
jgi:hypothetical protein